MKRAIYGKLLEWKEDADRKPLILKGVRQCGKTYILKEFGEKEYDHTAYFSFEGNTRLSEIFKPDLNPRRIIDELNIKFDAGIDENTLIIFDEIQFCGEALNSLKYFCEEAPEYDIVCAGSLLGVMLSKPLSFPVGKVNFLTMTPMTFFEFLDAIGKTQLKEHLLSQSVTKPLTESVMGLSNELLSEYMFVGGMPEAVKSWSEHRDVKKLRKIQSEILDSYMLDFSKHAPSSEIQRINSIWSSIPSQLSKENKRFYFGHIVKGARARDLADSTQWLIDAGLVFKVTSIEKPGIPLSSYENPSKFKLYMSDVGLLAAMADVPASSILFDDDAYREFKGSMTENYVVTEIAATNAEMHYWESEGKAEVDLIIKIDGKAVPIEIKSGSNVRAFSVREYMSRYGCEYGLLISKRNITSTNIRQVPLVLAGRLGDFGY